MAPRQPIAKYVLCDLGTGADSPRVTIRPEALGIQSPRELDDLSRQLKQLQFNRPGKVVVDLSNWPSVGYPGNNILSTLREVAAHSGCWLEVVSNPRVARELELYGANRGGGLVLATAS